jgi:two-component system nitrogen regulation response regulator NtrX
MKRVAVVEDHPKIRANLLFLLDREGFRVTGFETAEAFLSDPSIMAEPPDLILLDVRLPGMSGVELVRRLVEEDRFSPTIVVSGEATVCEAVEALQHGVYDFLEKPFSEDRLLRSVHNALDHHGLKREVKKLQAQLADENTIIGESDPVRRMRHMIERLAVVESSVLIMGESGTGKELIADAIHRLSPRAGGPLVKVNCAALPRHLIEDELFGHIRGAYTDARSDRSGLFEQAKGGTLFLDEIGDMDPALQTRLLRVLEEKTVRRLGGNRDRRIDVRVIAATNQNLDQSGREGRFREDLFYRLAQLLIEVPPLRDRGSDITLLFAHFLFEASARQGQEIRHVDPAVTPILQSYSWPGNVRELRNLCERLVVLGGDPIQPEHLPSNLLEEDSKTVATRAQHSNSALKPTLREFRRRCEKEYIENVLNRCGWNFSEAAKVLALQRTYLHQKVVKLGITRPG